MAIDEKTLDKIKKTFNSVYYRKDGKMDLSEVSQIDPKQSSTGLDRFSSTLHQTPMKNKLKIIKNFKPR